ncbi:MAG: hypothetical protein A2252_09595 [Elusimicrobia bacterium RIFOXYA2_FULL_39_19]|nr:MAG: hypothetical protein A2252_09595 [Elusimicrobia bacterium RIFOXYA2_FULL_39_19]
MSEDRVPYNVGNQKPKQKTATIEEAVKAQAIVQEAMINLLEKKGLLSKEELLKEIERIKILIDSPNKN